MESQNGRQIWTQQKSTQEISWNARNPREKQVGAESMLNTGKKSNKPDSSETQVENMERILMLRTAKKLIKTQVNNKNQEKLRSGHFR